MKPSIFLSLLLSLIISISSWSQNKIITKNGLVTFEASVPSYEEIRAINENVSCVMNITNGDVNALVLIKQFQFKIPLMEEHFNGNFMESDSYPKATFKGNIENFKLEQLGTEIRNYKLTGKLKIHGVTQKISVPATLQRTKEGISLKTKFNIRIEDYKIYTPEILSQKIAKNALVSISFLLK